MVCFLLHTLTMYENNTSQILGTSVGTGSVLTILGVPLEFSLILGFAIFLLLLILYLVYKVRNRKHRLT